MKSLITTVKESWIRFMLEVAVIGAGIYGGLTLKAWSETQVVQKATVHNNLPDPLRAGWKGASVCEIVEENEKIRVLKCVFPPGVGHEKHYHPPHTGYTLAGGTFQITDTTGTRTVEVPTGYVFTNDEITVHEVLNVGERVAEFLIIEGK